MLRRDINGAARQELTRRLSRWLTNTVDDDATGQPAVIALGTLLSQRARQPLASGVAAAADVVRNTRTARAAVARISRVAAGTGVARQAGRGNAENALVRIVRHYYEHVFGGGAVTTCTSSAPDSASSSCATVTTACAGTSASLAVSPPAADSSGSSLSALATNGAVSALRFDGEGSASAGETLANGDFGPKCRQTIAGGRTWGALTALAALQVPRCRVCPVRYRYICRCLPAR